MTASRLKRNVITTIYQFPASNTSITPDSVHAGGRVHLKLLESTSHCFMPLVTPDVGGSSSVAAPEVSAPEVSAPAESKRKRLGKQSDTLPAKQLRKDHPSFATGTGGKTLAGLRQLMPISLLVSRPSFQADIQAHVVQSARITDVLVYTAAATVTSARENVGITPTSDVAGSSQLETSEGSDDSFYELHALNSAEAKRCMDYEQLYTEFNVGAARQICLESKVRSHAEHELELKEKLKGKYDARGRLLEKKDLEILRLKSLLVEEAEKAERVETAEVVRLRGQVSAMTGEVLVLKTTVAQKDTDISLLDSRATYLNTALDELLRGIGLPLRFLPFTPPSRILKRRQKLSRRSRPRCFITLAVLKCFKSPEYQGIMGHALGRAVDFGMQEGLEAGHEHAVEAYNPEAVRASYFDAVRDLEDVDFPL
ncbi:hypothetical protein Tco_1462618, partial [Tanacetum coccineum]